MLYLLSRSLEENMAINQSSYYIAINSIKQKSSGGPGSWWKNIQIRWWDPGPSGFFQDLEEEIH